ncbi:MAG: ABC transporter ATP-binding protein, partial [Candidatus Methanomethylophilaceae archaeon]|nr:ABC transporter ATP-binding protein [Candidatus Methanomethylophilaceae archaeon]
STDELIVFIQFLVLFITCANITPFLVTTVPQVRAAFGRISKVMNGQSEMPGEHIPDDYEGPLLECTNGLTIERGTETSMVGYSGSGRGEFIRCLLRLDDVEPGSMKFKGKDVSELDPRELRGSIAYAGNLATAFSGTVRNNITVWRDVSDERLSQAMKAAKVELDPETVLGVKGSNISMGQIQKISIARALASNADLYIFDDCFTELDPKTENEIVSNIRGMLKGKTVLFSSHQFRISPGSDVVDVMDAGRIIDSGTHDDLVGRCDLYRRMYLAGGGLSD